MAEIIKIALLGIAGVLFAIQFRQQRPEYALLIGFALSILVFSFVCRMAGNLLEEFRGLQQYLGDSKGYLGILMKVVGKTKETDEKKKENKTKKKQCRYLQGCRILVCLGSA